MQGMGIWPKSHSSGKLFMHQLQSNIIFPKMLHLKSQFSWNIYNPSFHTIIFSIEYKSMLISNLRYMLAHILHVNHQKCQFGRHPALRRKCSFALSDLGTMPFAFVLGQSPCNWRTTMQWIIVLTIFPLHKKICHHS